MADEAGSKGGPVGPSAIEDYGLIGDCYSAALVSRSGSIDWLCWPRFDSAACFAALLGNSDNGCWLIGPADGSASTSRSYRDGSVVLETRFATADGEVALIDFMPVDVDIPRIVRLVRGLRGRVRMKLELTLRFDYGALLPWVTRLEDGGGISGIAGPDMVVLRTPVDLVGRDMRTLSEFEVAEGETVPFVLSYGPSHKDPPPPIDPEVELRRTEKFWNDWSGRCGFQGPNAEAVRRSLITLKALTYAPTGGIVAAPTTSLPEQLGGGRNWDYRFCWLRDATITLLAFMHAGYFDEAREWGRWLLRSVAGSPDQIQIMYGIAGERRLLEWEADWLGGYQGASPVRIGNAAHKQVQLDIFGELMDAFHQVRAGGLQVERLAALLLQLRDDRVSFAERDALKLHRCHGHAVLRPDADRERGTCVQRRLRRGRAAGRAALAANGALGGLRCRDRGGRIGGSVLDLRVGGTGGGVVERRRALREKRDRRKQQQANQHRARNERRSRHGLSSRPLSVIAPAKQHWTHCAIPFDEMQAFRKRDALPHAVVTPQKRKSDTQSET